jgi:ABC-2 type transport system ATP-binding protein
VCLKRAEVRRALRDEPLVRSIEIFGEALHALVASAATAMPQIQRRLDDARIGEVHLREIPPSLEDAFVARLTA